MSELNLVLLGPPGSGKGTQGERLQSDFRLPYYATGDILRAAVRDETEIGREAKQYMDRGDLVPDEVIIGVIARARRGQGGRRRLHPRRLSPHHRPGRGARRGARGPRPRADRGDPDRRPRRGGRAPARRPADLRQEGPHLPCRVRPAQAGGRLRHLRRRARRARRRQARGDPQPARPYHEKTEPLVGYYEDARPAAARRRLPQPDEVGERIRALLATLRMEEEI